MKELIKRFLKNFSQKFSATEEINSDEDFERVDKWVKKTSKSYKRHTIAAIIITIIITIVLGVCLSQQTSINGVVTFFICLLLGAIYCVIFELAFLGLATIKMHRKEVLKNAWTVAKYGYQVGEQIQTTHIDVTHEFGDTYKVTSRTEDKGLLVAVISAVVIMLAWGAFCVYRGSFLTIKKIKESKKNLEEYKKA